MRHSLIRQLGGKSQRKGCAIRHPLRAGQNGRGWIRDFGQRRALNPGYATASVPVPIDMLMPAISRATLISV